MKITTLQDFHGTGLPDTEDFFSTHRLLQPAEFRKRVQDTYGIASARDNSLRQTVNDITLLYLDASHPVED